MPKKSYSFSGKLQESRQEIVNAIVNNMEKGYVLLPPKWTKISMRPYNPASQIYYKAGNVIRLIMASQSAGFQDPRWCTYKQAEKMGWNVKRGSKGVLLEKWIFTEEKKVMDEKTGTEKKEIVRLKQPKCNFFYVFNAEQIHGIPKLNIPETNWEQDKYLDVADKMIQVSDCPIIEKGNEAFYRPSEDKIYLPPRGRFINTESFLATLLHEMAHSTGAENRLGRNISNPFGSENYAREELRAELASIFIQSDINLPPTAQRLQNNSNYLLSWISILKDDPNELFRACKDAEKASDYVTEKYTLFEKTEQKYFIGQLSENGIFEKEHITCFYTSPKDAWKGYIEAEISGEKVLGVCSDQKYEVLAYSNDKQSIHYMDIPSDSIMDLPGVRESYKFISEQVEKENIYHEVVNRVHELTEELCGINHSDYSFYEKPYVAHIVNPDRPQDYIRLCATEIEKSGIFNLTANTIIDNKITNTISCSIDTTENTQDIFAKNIAFEKALYPEAQHLNGVTAIYSEPRFKYDNYVKEHFTLLQEKGYPVNLQDFEKGNQAAMSIDSKKTVPISEPVRIAKELKKMGCTPNKGLVRNIEKLQKHTGRKYTAESLNKLNPKNFEETGIRKLAVCINNQIQALIPVPH